MLVRHIDEAARYSNYHEGFSAGWYARGAKLPCLELTNSMKVFLVIGIIGVAIGRASISSASDDGVR